MICDLLPNKKSGFMALSLSLSLSLSRGDGLGWPDAGRTSTVGSGPRVDHVLPWKVTLPQVRTAEPAS